MITKETCIEKIEEMLVDANKSLLKEAKRLLNSGAVDLWGYDNNYELPEILLAVGLDNLVDQYYPLSPKGKKEASNLQHF